MYFASKALTEAQRGYVAIELESFAVALAMEKFHHFLYTSHFILRQIKSHWEQYYLRALIKQLQDCSA